MKPHNPKKHGEQSQTQKIANYLLKGRSLTSLQALKLFGCFRLASRVREIRETYKVKTEIVKTKGGSRIGKYSIQL